MGDFNLDGGENCKAQVAFSDLGNPQEWPGDFILKGHTVFLHVRQYQKRNVEILSCWPLVFQKLPQSSSYWSAKLLTLGKSQHKYTYPFTEYKNDTSHKNDSPRVKR